MVCLSNKLPSDASAAGYGPLFGLRDMRRLYKPGSTLPTPLPLSLTWIVHSIAFLLKAPQLPTNKIQTSQTCFLIYISAKWNYLLLPRCHLILPGFYCFSYLAHFFKVQVTCCLFYEAQHSSPSKKPSSFL